MSNIRIQKRDGSLSVLDISKIQKQTKDATADLEGVSQSELEIDAQIKFVDMMKSSDIEDSLIKTAVEKIDIDRPNWTFVAARLFVYDLYHKVGKAMKGEKGKPYAPIAKYYEIGEKEEKLHAGVSLKYDLERIDEAIIPSRDFLFNYLGIKTLYDRYLIKNSKKEPIELPQHMFMALSMFLAQDEKYFPTHEESLKYSHLKIDSPEYEKAAKTSWAIEFYNLISKFEVMLATPTLSNGRTNRHQLSSCYIGSNFDNIEGIFDAYKEKALLSKFGGGIGWDWSQIRAMKNAIAGHAGAAGGYIPFLKIENDLAIAVDQLGCVAENTYVEVLHTVTTNHGTHDFRKEYVKIDLSKRERIENIAGFASLFAFEYGKFSKNLISSLLFDYIVNTKDHHFLYTLYGMTKEQYKKIINKYKKINKGLPVGFRVLESYKDYAISDDGIVIYLKTLKPLSQQIDRKGYTRITIGKNSVALHKLLVKTFLNVDIKDLTIDHIDDNKQNNNLDNFKIISNEDNISKSWEKNSELRKEKIKLKAYFSHRKNLNGRRTSAGNETVIEEITTKRILIGQVRSGDLIKSYNVKTGEVEYKDVLSVYDIDVKEESQIKLVYSNGNYIVTSLWHPTLIKVNGQFTYIRADETNVGDIALDSNNQEVNVIEVVLNPGYSSNYKDLTVKDNNNYFASTDNKDEAYHLIHNTRKGAIAVYSEPWHMDILDFLDLKKNSGEERRRTHDLFPALWISDLFMKRVKENGQWTLFSPNNVPLLTETYGEEFEKAYIGYENDESIPKQVLNAKEIWKKILTQYFETGNPFLAFKDTANRANPNPHTGHIRSSNLCVTGDTRLATQFGLVKAKDLFDSKKKILATYDYRTDGERKKYGVGVAECIEMHKTQENADIYEIKTKDGYSIKSTDWHEYYVNRDDNIIKIPLKEIRDTDKLLIQSDIGQFGKEGSYDLGLLTGFITGDGTFSIKEKKNYSIAHIDLYNEDINLKDLIYSSLNNVINNEYRSLKNSFKADIDIVMPKEIQHTTNSKKIRFSSSRLGRILDENYNFNKTNKHSVPEFIFKGTKETVKGYLQGLFISDSCVEIIKNDGIPSFNIKLASIEKKLLEEVQILLSNLGIRSKIYNGQEASKKPKFKYTTKSGENREYNSKSGFLLSIHGNNAIRFIETIGLLGVKQEKALNIMKIRVEKLGKYSSNKSEYFETKIVSIKHVGKEDVYDTTQLLNHSLIFNGLVTGNCTEIFQNTSPDKYKIKIELLDGTIVLFDEEEYVELSLNKVKKAKHITALDSLYGQKIFIVEKERIDGETAVCNLGSINLSKINSKEDLQRVIPIAIRMLDNVIDLNFYPLRKVKVTNLKTRAIGLGVMGEGQMLAEKGILYGSQEHLNLIDEIMDNVSYEAIMASSKLAEEKGSYPTFKGSNWEKGIMPFDHANELTNSLVSRTSQNDWLKARETVRNKGIRNGYLMAIAPTSSISILVGTTQAIEPVYKKKWFEENLSGLIPVVVPNLSPDTWNYYPSAYDVDPFSMMRAGAIRQKWIDQGQSLNMFLKLVNVTGKMLNDLYMFGWELGLKSNYYLRSQSPDAKKAEMDVADRKQECEGCQ